MDPFIVTKLNLSKTRIPRSKICKLVDEVESTLRWCSSVLRTGRTNPKEFAEAVLAFQPRLMGALRLADELYRAILHERRVTVSSKSRLDPKWFRRRMATLETYRKVASQCVGMARALGDGFAWIFYSKDPGLLDKHLEHQRPFLLAPGIGGVGEQAIVERMPVFNGLYVISHSITSMLRMGDLSLYDPEKRRVVGIGEVKTEQIDESHCRLTIALIGNTGDGFPFGRPGAGTVATDIKLSAPLKAKLRKQTSEISRSIRIPEQLQPEITIGVEGEYPFSALEQIGNTKSRNIVTTQPSPSLLLGALRDAPGKTLSRRLLPTHSFRSARIRGIEGATLNIMKLNATDNSLLVDFLGFDDNHFPTIVLGGIPFIHWPMEYDILEKILFGELIILVLYNPAHLWAMLREKGFEVATKGGRISRLTSTLAGEQVVVTNPQFFQNLTTTALVPDNVVTLMISKCVAQARRLGRGTRVQIRPRLMTRAHA